MTPEQLTFPEPVRHDDPDTSRRGAADVAPRAGSQRHRLLAAYAAAGEGGLTADEAQAAAQGVALRSCYWKRVSELVHADLLEDTGLERMGDQGSLQRVNRITELGRSVL